MQNYPSHIKMRMYVFTEDRLFFNFVYAKTR